MKGPGTFFFQSWNGSLAFSLQPIFAPGMYIIAVLRNGCPGTDIVSARPKGGYSGLKWSPGIPKAGLLTPARFFPSVFQAMAMRSLTHMGCLPESA